MANSGKSPGSGVVQALALVSELGFAIAIPIVVGALAGDYLDDRYGGRGAIFIVIFLMGLASGLYNAYRLLRNVVEKNK